MTPTPRFSEDGRQLVHLAAGALALLLRYLTPPEAMVVAGVAIAFNFYALPHLAGSLFRPVELHKRAVSGIVLYPTSVLLLIFLFPDRFDIVAAAWGIMAVGDGMATIAGRRLSSPRIPWNPGKSVAGSVAFLVFGGAAGALLSWWCRPNVIPPPYAWFSTWMPFAAAAAGAAAETLPIRLDDNVSVPAAAAAVLWWTSLINDELAAVALANAGTMLPLAIAANAVVAAAGYFARTVTVSGAIGGALIGIAIVASAGWCGWALLLATFVAAVIASRLGLRRKTLLGIAQGRGGRRGAANAFANTGVAAAAAVLSVISYAGDLSLVAFVTALAAGGSDTVASEIGKAWGRRTVLVTTFRRVPPGTSGAVSLEGTAAGVAGALALGAIGAACGLVPAAALFAIVAGATVGSLAESVLGASLEDPGVLNNDVLNFLNTAIGAFCAVWIVQAFR